TPARKRPKAARSRWCATATRSASTASGAPSTCWWTKPSWPVAAPPGSRAAPSGSPARWRNTRGWWARPTWARSPTPAASNGRANDAIGQSPSGDSAMDTSFAIVVALGAFFVLVVVVYNRLVALRNRVDNALAQIDVQLKRRHDLIPNLVETARGYLAHERGALEAVVAARDAARAAGEAALGPGRGHAGDPEAMAGL